MRMTKWWIAPLLLVIATAGSGTAQQRPTLGPKDGAGLTPTDTGRVTVGRPAPDWTLESRDGSAVTLSDFRTKRNVVLVFYRGHW